MAKRRLTNLKVNEVSLVDDGANQLADVVLMKLNERGFSITAELKKAIASNESLNMLIEAVSCAVRDKYGPSDPEDYKHHVWISAVHDGTVIFTQDGQYYRSDYSVETAADGTKTYAIDDRVPVQVVYEDMKKENAMEKKPDQAAVDTNKAAQPDLAALVAAEVEKARTADKTEFQKQLDAANAIAKAAQERAEKAEQAAEVEKNARETIEFEKMAKADLPNLTGSDAEKGAVLKSLSRNLPKDDFAAVLKLLKAGDAAMEKKFTSVGKTGTGASAEGSAIEKLDTLAKARATEKRISFAKAKEQILSEQPGMYDEIRAEEREMRRAS